MSIAEKEAIMSANNKTMAENQQKVYDAGYAAGQAESGAIEELPNGYLKIDPSWTDFSYLCVGRRYSLGENLKYDDTANGTNFQAMFQAWDQGEHIIPRLNTSNGKNFTNMFIYSAGIIEIGEMDISNATNVNTMFHTCSNLKRIWFVPGCIKISISFAWSSLLEDTSIQSIIDGLADLTGSETKTLTLHASIVLTDEQKATIAAKNWTLVQ